MSSPKEVQRFLKICPEIEKYITDAGITLIKFWLEVGQEEQEKRFLARINDPVRQWKLSPMDLESYRRWYDYSRARDAMLKATDTDYAPWHIVRSDDKRRARLNCISKLLDLIPYKKVTRPKVKLPKRSSKGHYDDQASLARSEFSGRAVLEGEPSWRQRLEFECSLAIVRTWHITDLAIGSMHVRFSLTTVYRQINSGDKAPTLKGKLSQSAVWPR